MTDTSEPSRQDPPAGLVARARATDRAARFRRRLARLRERRADRRRRRRAGAVLAAVLLAVVPGVSGWVLDGAAGLLVGAGVSAGLGAVVLVAVRIARGRGAVAWDWKTQRHVLLGDPSKRVQELDSSEPPRGPLST